MIRPVEIYRNVPPHDPSVPRPVAASRVTFADLATYLPNVRWRPNIRGNAGILAAPQFG